MTTLSKIAKPAFNNLFDHDTSRKISQREFEKNNLIPVNAKKIKDALDHRMMKLGEKKKKYDESGVKYSEEEFRTALLKEFPCKVLYHNVYQENQTC